MIVDLIVHVVTENLVIKVKVSNLTLKTNRMWIAYEQSTFFIIVFRLVRDVVANHKTTRYAGAATKVIQKNHLA
jgi:hypothetical protein